MERLVAGDVISAYFPYSDSGGEKLRPAIVLAESDSRDVIVCQVTSKRHGSKWSFEVGEHDFQTGGLPRVSYARVNKLFTIDRMRIKERRGSLSEKMTGSVLRSARSLFSK